MSGASSSTRGSSLGPPPPARPGGAGRCAAPQLGALDILVGLVGDAMSPGPHTTLAIPRAANSPASVPNGILRGRVAPAAAQHRRSNAGLSAPRERRIAHQLGQAMPRPGGARASPAELAWAKAWISASSAAGSSPRQGAELELEAAGVRHDVERRAALDSPVVTVQWGGIEAVGRNGPRARKSRLSPPQADDDLGGDLDGVDALMIERGVAGEPGHAAGVAGLALVGVGDAHAGGLADHAAQRRRRQRSFAGDRAAAARPCSRPPRRSSARGGSGPRSPRSKKSGTSARTAAMKPFMSACRGHTGGHRARRTPTVARPVLAVDRDHVGMAGEHEAGAAPAARWSRSDWPCRRSSSNTSSTRCPSHRGDRGRTRSAPGSSSAGGVEGDQPRQHLDGIGRLALDARTSWGDHRTGRADCSGERLPCHSRSPRAAPARGPEPRWSGPRYATILSLQGEPSAPCDDRSSSPARNVQR